MSSLVINLFKGQHVDLTAQMKDADLVLDKFQEYGIKFEKKFTTISGDGPSTITFKGLKPEKIQSDLTNLLFELHEKAKNDEIGNIYLKFRGFKPDFMKKKSVEQQPAVDISGPIVDSNVTP